MVALPRLVDTPRVQALIASGASQALGRPVRYRSLTVSVLPYPTLRLHGFEVAEDPAFGADPFVRLDERSEEHTSELQSLRHLVCRLLLEKKNSTIHEGAITHHNEVS